MRRRLLIVALVVAIFAIVAKWTYEHSRLVQYIQTIEDRYTSSILLIESSSRELPSRDDMSEAAWEKKEAMMNSIERALSAPEIVAAGWSVDGHHGSNSLRPWGCDGYSTTSIYWATAANGRHKVRYGKSFDGRNLIVLEGLVPDGAKHVFHIAFLADELNQH